MGFVDELLEAKNHYIPEEGFNLVGVDKFERFGEELFLLGEYDTREKAEAAQAARKKEHPDETTYIYDKDS